MKKSLVLGILGLATAAFTSYGQGYMQLDNYLSAGTLVTYGVGVPLNGVSGPLGTPGNPLNNAWTVGFYWAAGTTGLSEAGGIGLPDASLTLATGAGSTAAVADAAAVFGILGEYSSTAVFNSGSTLNTTLTLEVVVYDAAGGSYAGALYRGHSAAFSMPTAGATSASFPETGASMPGTLSVGQVPEPTTLALAGLGGLALLLMRRKQS